MGDAAVRAEVSGVHGQAFGRVKDLSLTGAAVQFGVEQTTAFVSGEKTTLVFHFQYERPVQVEVIVRTQTEMDGFRQFGFTFLTPCWTSVFRAICTTYRLTVWVLSSTRGPEKNWYLVLT